MDMLSTELIDLYDPKWPIMSRSPSRPPQVVGEHANVRHSIITEGCIIEGNVDNSVLSNQAVVQEGAVVEYSVLMPGAVVESGARVSYAILGEGSHVCAGAVVGSAPDGDEGWAVATVGPDVVVEAGAVVASGAMIYDNVEAAK